MEDCIGTLSVFTYVTLPNGQEKRAALASIVCGYTQRKEKFSEFREANPMIRECMLGAKFTFSEWVSTD